MSNSQNTNAQRHLETQENITMPTDSLPTPVKKEMANSVECINGVYQFPEYKRQVIKTNPEERIPDSERLLKTKHYIDKTKILGGVFTGAKKILLTRPHRFGKTTFLDTVQLIAGGEANRHMFKGTYLYDQPWKNLKGQCVDENGNKLVTPKSSVPNIPELKKAIPFPWKTYPVIRLDFYCTSSEDAVKEMNYQLQNDLSSVANRYGVSKHLDECNISPPDACGFFSALIYELTHLGNSYEEQVIILIDNYDSIINDQENLDKKYKKDIDNFLIDFYSQVKSANSNIHLLIITGINPIRLRELASPIDIWSDETVDSRYSDIIGFTEEEIRESFDIELFKEIYYSDYSFRLQESSESIDNYTIKEIVMCKLAERYNGYKFSSEGPSVYNSNSVVNAFANNKITNYWIMGYPSRLAYKAILQCPLILQKLYKKETIDFISEDMLNTSIENDMNSFNKAIAAGFQLGYLTIDKQHTKDEIKLEIKKLRIIELEKDISDSEYTIMQLNDEKLTIEDDPNKTRATKNEKIKLMNAYIKISSTTITKSEDKLSKIKTEDIDAIVKENDMGFDFELDYYSLKIPNHEVYKNLIPAVERTIFNFGKNNNLKKALCTKLRKCIANDNWTGFFKLLNDGLIIHTYTVPDDLISEKDFRSSLCLMLLMLGIDAKPEYRVNARKRADIYFTFDDKIYIFELKVYKSPYSDRTKDDIGFVQAYKYYLPNFLSEHKEIYVIGVNFSIIHAISDRTTRLRRDDALGDVDYTAHNNINNVYMKNFSPNKEEIEHWSIAFQPDGTLEATNTDPVSTPLDQRRLR